VNPETGESLSGARFDAVPFDLTAGLNQPVWVDVYIPRSAVPGAYAAGITVTSDQGETVASASLTVWNFELPLKPSCITHFPPFYDDSRATAIMLLKNRLMPAPPAQYERELIDDWGLTANSAGFWGGATWGNCEMSPAPSVAEFQDSRDAHQDDILLYDYSADEISDCQNLYPTIRQWGENMHQVGIKQLIVMKPLVELSDVVDIWSILPVQWDDSKDEIAQVQDLGNLVWSYTALNQDDYSPKWEIDFRPVEHRIYGFINQSLILTGLLYWCVDYWQDMDPWGDVYSYDEYPGEGFLIYRGEDVGINGAAPSMRLKWLREAVEDYEYVEILKGLDKGDWALNTIAPIAQDWRIWTRNTDSLYAVRQLLGEEIQKTFVSGSIDRTPVIQKKQSVFNPFLIRGQMVFISPFPETSALFGTSGRRISFLKANRRSSVWSPSTKQ